MQIKNGNAHHAKSYFCKQNYHTNKHHVVVSSVDSKISLSFYTHILNSSVEDVRYEFCVSRAIDQDITLKRRFSIRMLRYFIVRMKENCRADNKCNAD